MSFNISNKETDKEGGKKRHSHLIILEEYFSVLLFFSCMFVF